MEEVNVIIEISKGGHIKYEYDKEKHMLVCDRILHTPMKYPFNKIPNNAPPKWASCATPVPPLLIEKYSIAK